MYSKENNFIENISNEATRALPLGSFEGEVVVVESATQVDMACVELKKHAVVGFDTETRPTFKPGALNKVALLQLSIPNRCYLFRLCKMPLEKSIINILESKTILKIGADVKGDIKALQELKRFKPNGFIELQSIISQWGIAEKSVRKMSGIVLGKRVSKAQRLSNWEALALTPAQQVYAATDAWVCVEIFVKLNATDKKPLPAPEPKPKVVKTKPRKAREKRRKGEEKSDKNIIEKIKVKKEAEHKKPPEEKPTKRGRRMGLGKLTTKKQDKK